MDIDIGPPPLADLEQHISVNGVPLPHHEVGPQETCEYFPGAAWIHSTRPTFMDNFNADQYSSLRNANFYYPFASRQEWELALWLLRSGLSMNAIDRFLKLLMVRFLRIEF